MKAWQPQVYLVGAGPGDPGLLTRRGEVCLRRADVIFYDNLTNPELLSLARADAEKIYVGKKARQARPDQEWINARLIEEAHKGRIVLRLKGGDSFVFGRGGEEVQALFDAGIRFEVVPGVSSAIAAPAAAGIPVTHRGLNTTFHVAVGFEDPADPACSVPWESLGATGHTIIIMMATAHITGILERIKAGGRADDTPVATIQNGTYCSQASKRSTLGEALADISKIHLPPPSITIVGSVAGLDEGLNWFERRPLFGRRIILTRPLRNGDKPDAIGEALAEAGACVQTHAAIQFQLAAPQNESVHSFTELLEPLQAARGWLILPSPAAIRSFFDKLEAFGLDARALGGIRVAAIGGASVAALKSHGIAADFVPVKSHGAALAESLPLAGENNRALIAGSSISRPELADGLRKRGVDVTHLHLYSTQPDPPSLAALKESLEKSETDSVIVFSPSAVDAIQGSLNLAIMNRAGWYAIGETTAQALKDCGINPRGIASSPTADALIEALAEGAP